MASHLDMLEKAVEAWLEYEYKTSPQYEVDEPEQYRSYRLNLMEGVYAKPEQPEPLTILRRLRRFDLPMWPGGYSDQPCYLMQELNVVIETEIEHANRMSFNALLRQRTKSLTGNSQTTL